MFGCQFHLFQSYNPNRYIASQMTVNPKNCMEKVQPHWYKLLLLFDKIRSGGNTLGLIRSWHYQCRTYKFTIHHIATLPLQFTMYLRYATTYARRGLEPTCRTHCVHTAAILYGSKCPGYFPSSLHPSYKWTHVTLLPPESHKLF